MLTRSLCRELQVLLASLEIKAFDDVNTAGIAIARFVLASEVTRIVRNQDGDK